MPDPQGGKAGNVRRPGAGVAWEDHADALPSNMSDGQVALEAVAWHQASSLPYPDWALEEIADCYDFFKNGAPVSGWVQENKGQKAPRTLGEAFDIPDHKNIHAERKRKKAMYQSRILVRFNGPNSLSKNDDNYEVVAIELGLSKDEVRAIVIKG